MADVTSDHNPSCGTSRNTFAPLRMRASSPSEEVLELLPVSKIAPFTNEAGGIVEDTGNRRS